MNSLVIPIVMWGGKPPTHKIRAITMTEERSHIITGCVDGQICVWSLDDNLERVLPKMLLFGHSSTIASIKPISNTGKDSATTHFISASTNGELCLWDLADGRCIEQTKIAGSPTHLMSFAGNLKDNSEPYVLCFGLFAEIFILSPSSLNVAVTLVSRIYPDWIGSCCIIPSETETSVIGLTVSGTIKVWQIQRSHLQRCVPVLEDESKQLRCKNTVQLEHISHPGNLLLVVGTFEWQLYDASDFSLLCTLLPPGVPALGGGNFFSDDGNIILWDQSGSVFVYQVPFTSSNQEEYRDNVKVHSIKTPKLLYSFSGKQSNNFSSPPVVNLFHDSLGSSEAILTIGNSFGELAVWSVGNAKQKCEESITLLCSESMSGYWDGLVMKPAGMIDQVGKDISHSVPVTTSLYLENWGQMACGREDGTIVLIPASKACKAHLLQDERVSKKGWVPHRTLRGHQDRITCLLYPHQESTRYSAQMFASGSADFSVILWEVVTGVQLHVFNIHGGEITQLIVPPEECSSRVQQSICSVASDHSVSLLSVRERKCVMLASSHTSTVTTIKWRPLDDFMLVACADGGLFVWQMETGHLDRHVSGLTAIEILAACDQCQSNRTDNVVQGSVNLSQAFKRRSLAGFKAAAQQGLKNIIETIGDKLQEDEAEHSHASAVACSNAMLVQPIRACPTQDYDSHVLFFNTEAIIGTLLQEQALQRKISRAQKRTENGGKNSARKAFNAFIYQVKNQLLENSDFGSSAQSSPTEQRRGNDREKRKQKKDTLMEMDSVMHIAQLLLSCLHGWGLDKKLDNLCRNQLGIYEPISPICFGLLSREGQTALMLPSWSKKYQYRVDTETSNLNGCNHTVFINERFLAEHARNGTIPCSHMGHWEISSSVTTQHLISVISIANTMMELSSLGFSHSKHCPQRNNHAIDESTSSNLSESCMSNPSEMAQVKQGWSLLATMHCVLLPELLDSNKYMPAKLELLARRWQDRCLEVREAAQAILLAKLRQIEPDGRRKIVQNWARYMPDYIQQQQHIDLIPNTRNEESNNSALNSISQSSTTADDMVDRSSITSSELATEALPQPQRHTQKLSYESRRKQATAVVILGVIGAEFGQEMEPSRSTSTSPTKSGQPNADIPDGFRLSNDSLARNTCKALVYLLLHPASPRLPAHAPIRRAAIDLLGRGFTVWEPYIEVSAVLLGLLELCVDYDSHIASIQSGLPLSAHADSCRSSHHALCLIATARPLTFITTIAREVARHNAAAVNPQHQALLATSIIVRSKAEVLRIIELLADKMMSDVLDLLVEVIDIILFCIDTTILRTSNSLIDAVPALSRFPTISYDPRTRRIAVGTRHGAIYLYELRTNKHQEIFRGRCGVSALSFSPEGKYLSVFSVQDNHLSFWMTSSSLFGMLQSQVKCVKTIRPLPAAVSQRLALSPDHMRDSFRNFIKLTWINNRITVLLLPDGNEYRCHV